VARVRQEGPEMEPEDAGRALNPSMDATAADVQDEDGLRTRPTSSIASRAEAFARLREASDYLLRTEPHSPVPYLVRRAVAWGNMSLSQLLEELLASNTDLSTIDTLLGIRRTAGR